MTQLNYLVPDYPIKVPLVSSSSSSRRRVTVQQSVRPARRAEDSARSLNAVAIKSRIAAGGKKPPSKPRKRSLHSVKFTTGSGGRKSSRKSGGRKSSSCAKKIGGRKSSSRTDSKKNIGGRTKKTTTKCNALPIRNAIF